ncbi:MAG TPA: hypothetical protein VGK69_06875 [Gaiellaceae bacterium]
MRRALLSVAVTLAGAAGVTASGWAIQAAALPPPTSATRVAADASAWFHEHRLVVDVFHFDHRRIKGACLRGWFPRPHEPKARASLLSLRPGRPLRVPERRHPWIAAARRSGQPGRILALVGCTGELAPALAAAAQSGGHLTTERSYAANQPAVALELEHAKAERLTLYVSPRTDEPLVAFVHLHELEATSRLFLARVTPLLASRFHLPRAPREPRR